MSKRNGGRSSHKNWAHARSILPTHLDSLNRGQEALMLMFGTFIKAHAVKPPSKLCVMARMRAMFNSLRGESPAEPESESTPDAEQVPA